jgi:hypothetical protein
MTVASTKLTVLRNVTPYSLVHIYNSEQLHGRKNRPKLITVEPFESLAVTLCTTSLTLNNSWNAYTEQHFIVVALCLSQKKICEYCPEKYFKWDWLRYSKKLRWQVFKKCAPRILHIFTTNNHLLVICCKYMQNSRRTHFPDYGF